MGVTPPLTGCTVLHQLFILSSFQLPPLSNGESHSRDCYEVMGNVEMNKSQAGFKITRRDINNLRYADDIILTAESEELRSLLMKVKEEIEKAGLKVNILKTEIMASGSITSWQIEGEKEEAVTDFVFLGSKTIVDGDYNHEIKMLDP